MNAFDRLPVIHRTMLGYELATRQACANNSDMEGFLQSNKFIMGYLQCLIMSGTISDGLYNECIDCLFNDNKKFYGEYYK